MYFRIYFKEVPALGNEETRSGGLVFYCFFFTQIQTFKKYILVCSEVILSLLQRDKLEVTTHLKICQAFIGCQHR